MTDIVVSGPSTPLRISRAIAAFFCLVTLSCSAGSDPPVRVLFVGNSYTSTNDLPNLVRDLAGSVDRRVEVGMTAPGSWWWRDHAASPETLAVISEGDWDFVVLPKQSMAPAAPDLAREASYPAALQLSTLPVGSGAGVVLFMTWGHVGGSIELGFDRYESMQAAIAIQ